MSRSILGNIMFGSRRQDTLAQLLNTVAGSRSIDSVSMSCLTGRHGLNIRVGETGASCYRGRLLQGHFMQNYYSDGEIVEQQFYTNPPREPLTKQNHRRTRIIRDTDKNHFL